MTAYDLDVLKLAFARHVLDQMARADAAVLPGEREVIERVAPTFGLQAAGLLDMAGKPTPAFHQARTQALERLPRELPKAAKLELVTAFLELAVVDGQIAREEGSLLWLAAELLGVSSSEFDAHLDTLTEHVGEVELEDATQDEPSR